MAEWTVVKGLSFGEEVGRGPLAWVCWGSGEGVRRGCLRVSLDLDGLRVKRGLWS